VFIKQFVPAPFVSAALSNSKPSNDSASIRQAIEQVIARQEAQAAANNGKQPQLTDDDQEKIRVAVKEAVKGGAEQAKLLRDIIKLALDQVEFEIQQSSNDLKHHATDKGQQIDNSIKQTIQQSVKHASQTDDKVKQNAKDQIEQLSDVIAQAADKEKQQIDQVISAIDDIIQKQEQQEQLEKQEKQQEKQEKQQEKQAAATEHHKPSSHYELAEAMVEEVAESGTGVGVWLVVGGVFVAAASLAYFYSRKPQHGYQPIQDQI